MDRGSESNKPLVKTRKKFKSYGLTDRLTNLVTEVIESVRSKVWYGTDNACMWVIDDSSVKHTVGLH